MHYDDTGEGPYCHLFNYNNKIGQLSEYTESCPLLSICLKDQIRIPGDVSLLLRTASGSCL